MKIFNGVTQRKSLYLIEPRTGAIAYSYYEGITRNMPGMRLGHSRFGLYTAKETSKGSVCLLALRLLIAFSTCSKKIRYTSSATFPLRQKARWGILEFALVEKSACSDRPSLLVQIERISVPLSSKVKALTFGVSQQEITSQQGQALLFLTSWYFRLRK